MENKYQLISSLVVFDAFNKQGKDLFEILDSFIEFAIKDKNLNGFTHIEIFDYLKNEFGFEIPGAVIEQGLKRIVKNKKLLIKKDKKFHLNENNTFNIENIQSKINNATNDEKELYDELYTYFDLNITLEDKKTIAKELINYFLGYKQDKYTKEINRFVIKNRENPILKNISNGIILYNGLRYQNTFDDENWKELLNIYINMEIIFHYIGYNGEFFSKMIEELFELISEINKKKRVICLYYTSREKQRIEDFFYAIINNQKIENTVAAVEIKKRCGNDRIKITEEKIKLFRKLKEKIIFEKDIPNIDFNSDESKKFNVISNDIKEKIPTIDLIEDKLEFLNKLNILRANNNATIEKARYIFLTDENDYKEISKHIKEQTNGKVPIAIQVVFLTNILWLKLGKFSKKYNDELLIFKPDTRAKISTASGLEQHNNFLHEEIEKRKDLDEEAARKIRSELISSSIKPEEINENNIDSIMDMSGADLNYFLERHNLKEKEINKLKDENKNLQEQVQELSHQIVYKEKQLEQSNLREINNLKDKNENLEKQVQELLQQKNNDEKLKKTIELQKNIRNYYIQLGLTLIVCLIIIITVFQIPKELFEYVQLCQWIISGGSSFSFIKFFIRNIKKVKDTKNQLKELNND